MGEEGAGRRSRKASFVPATTTTTSGRHRAVGSVKPGSSPCRTAARVAPAFAATRQDTALPVIADTASASRPAIASRCSAAPTPAATESPSTAIRSAGS